MSLSKRTTLSVENPKLNTKLKISRMDIAANYIACKAVIKVILGKALFLSGHHFRDIYPRHIDLTKY